MSFLRTLFLLWAVSKVSLKGSSFIKFIFSSSATDSKRHWSLPRVPATCPVPLVFLPIHCTVLEWGSTFGQRWCHCFFWKATNLWAVSSSLSSWYSSTLCFVFILFIYFFLTLVISLTLKKAEVFLKHLLSILMKSTIFLSRDCRTSARVCGTLRQQVLESHL